MGAPVEAVIISGELKGALIEISEEELAIIDLRAAVDRVAEAAGQMAAEAKALRLQTETFVKSLRKRHGTGLKLL
jgi:hypothetical protein